MKVYQNANFKHFKCGAERVLFKTSDDYGAEWVPVIYAVFDGRFQATVFDGESMCTSYDGKDHILCLSGKDEEYKKMFESIFGVKIPKAISCEEPTNEDFPHLDDPNYGYCETITKSGEYFHRYFKISV